MKRVLPFLFVAMILTMPLAALAQTTPTPAPTTNNQEIQKTLDAVPKPKAKTVNPYEDLPDSYIQEAQNYYLNCQKDTNMNRYYDCKCMGAEYLNTRIDMGPKATSSAIGIRIVTKCADATGAAGYEYDKCLTKRPPQGMTLPFEDYCACYANTYAKLFEYSQVEASSKVFLAISMQASIACSEPALAQKMFPESPALSYANEILSRK
jgi:hypothetical protein